MTSLAAFAEVATMAPFVRTADVSKRLRMLMPATDKALRRMEHAGLVKKIAHGLWSIGRYDPFAAACRLADPHSAYISLLSALWHHGMIQQVPRDIYVVSTGRARRVQTPFGTVSIHCMSPPLFGRFSSSSRTIASPEKALFDCLYFSPTRSATFAALPEVELPRSFDIGMVWRWAALIRSAPRREAVESRLREIIAEQEVEASEAEAS